MKSGTVPPLSYSELPLQILTRETQFKNLLESKINGNSNLSVKDYLKAFSNDLSSVEQSNSVSIGDSHQLPLINVVFGPNKYLFLLDTGSTVSLIPRSILEEIKVNNKVKFLSRAVKIKTINSDLAFSACTEITFKIDKNFFKNQFFIANFQHEVFQGILGIDFISKYNLKIDTKNNMIHFDNFKVSLSKEHCTVNENVNLLTTFDVKTSRKLIIPPSESAHVQLTIQEAKLLDNTEIFFTPKDLNFCIEIHSSINTVAKNKFYTIIKNLSSENIHINKDTSLGFVTPHFELNSNEDFEENNSEEFCNLIQASDEVLSKRKQELLPTDFKLDHLNFNQKNALLDVLMQNYAAFSKSLNTMGCTDIVTPDLKLRNPNPIRTLPFEIPQTLQQQVRDELDSMVEAGIIRRNNSHWSFPLVLVKKKANSDNPKKSVYRLAMDLRLLNAVIENSTYPLPKIANIINEVSSYKHYCSLDFNNAFYQIALPENLQDILTVTTPFGSFSSSRLVFGLKTASSTFQALVDQLIDKLHVRKIKGVYAYLDDFLIGADTFEEMLKKISAVLQLLAEFNLTLSPAKCIFFSDEINYLGFHITHNLIKPVSSNICKITKFPTPKTPKQLKSFLGVCGFYRSLIPNYAELTSVLNALTSKKTKFQWTQEHQIAFDNLQSIFFSEPFVALPDYNLPFILNTDASASAISAVLLQKHGEIFKPISYYSKTLTKSEKSYPGIKLELYAIYKGINAFKSYLFNRRFTLMTDSKPLAHYKKSTSPADITTRWLMAISEYSFDFEHVAGKENLLPDFLSRCPQPERVSVIHDTENESLIMPFVETSDISDAHVNVLNYQHIDGDNEIHINTFLEEQAKDKNIQDIINGIQPKSTVKSKKRFQNFFISPSTQLVMHIDYKTNCETIVVPDSLKLKALNIAHISHTGVNKTFDILKRHYFWTGMYSDVVNFVLSCQLCVKHKPYTPKQAPFKSVWIPNRPGEFVSTDIVGPIADYGHVLTVIDHFSRYLVLYPLPNLTANTVAKNLLHYIANHGRMETLLSDLGTQFTAETFEILNKTLGIKLNHTTVGHPECNSISERVNTALKSTLLCLREDNVSLQTALAIHQSIYNGSTHSSTGFTPNLLHLGREVSLIFDTYNSDIIPIQLDKSHYLKTLLNDLKKSYEKAYSNLERKQVKQNSSQLAKSKLRILNIDDIVYLKSRDVFKPRFSGPYIVVEKHSDVNYSIKYLNCPHSTPFKVHINRLKLSHKRKSKFSDCPNTDSNTVPKTRYFLRSRKPSV